MRFKPDEFEIVNQTIFRNARVLTQDGKHAFYQLPISKEQSLKQCIKFYYPPFKKDIVCAFTVEMFGSSNSCYRFYIRKSIK